MGAEHCDIRKWLSMQPQGRNKPWLKNKQRPSIRFNLITSQVLQKHDLRKSNKLWYQTLAQDYLDFWNCVDWLAILMTAVICISFGLLHMFIGNLTCKFLVGVDSSCGARDRLTIKTAKRSLSFLQISGW